MLLQVTIAMRGCQARCPHCQRLFLNENAMCYSHVPKCKVNGVPKQYRFPLYTPQGQDTDLEGNTPWYPCFFEDCDRFRFVELAHLKLHLLIMHMPEAYRTFGLTEYELKGYLPQSTETSLISWPGDQTLHGSVQQSSRKSRPSISVSGTSAIDLLHKPVEHNFKLLTPSEVDQYDHAPDNQRGCEPRNDRDLEDEEVHHDKT